MRMKLLMATVGALALAFAQPGPAAAQNAHVTVQWYGQSATKITSPTGKVILIDPWLTKNPTTPERYKNLDNLGKIDLILVTHAHGDHLGDATDIAKKLNITLIGPAGMNQELVALGVLPPNLSVRMNKTGTYVPPGMNIKITQVHAEHSSEMAYTNPATGKEETHVGGEPVGLIIEFENGFKVYHMGDTGLFSDMKFIGEYYKPDLIMIPIGGHFVMDPKDAAYATNTWLKPKYAIPFHYGSNPFLKGTPAEYAAAMGKKTKVKVYDSLKPGDELTF